MDLQHLTKFCHTGLLEVEYIPKRIQFSYRGMVAQTELATIDHNNNVGRDQATTRDREPKFSLKFRKAHKQWRIRRIYKPSTHNYKKPLVNKVIEQRLSGARLEEVEIAIEEGGDGKPIRFMGKVCRFSNFYPCRVEIYGKVFASEMAYQWQKA